MDVSGTQQEGFQFKVWCLVKFSSQWFWIIQMSRSFGITMWEIFSFGEKPYNGMKHNDLKNFLKRDERIPVSLILNSRGRGGSWIQTINMIWEAPLKKTQGLFGHCPNSDCTPPLPFTQTDRLEQIPFELQFSLHKCPKPSWQGFRPPKPSKCPFEHGQFFSK